jgi:hypothetical protein
MRDLNRGCPDRRLARNQLSHLACDFVPSDSCSDDVWLLFVSRDSLPCWCAGAWSSVHSCARSRLAECSQCRDKPPLCVSTL